MAGIRDGGSGVGGGLSSDGDGGGLAGGSYKWKAWVGQ